MKLSQESSGGKYLANPTSPKSPDFVCPKCKQPLRVGDNTLTCADCGRVFPIIRGVPDFLSSASLAPATSHIAKVMDLVAPIYESRLFVSVLLRLSGIRNGPQFIGHIASFHAETLGGITGQVLDVACGPATYSRRLASPARDIYGIDISMGVLQQGRRYIARDHAPNVHLARARVEELPFEDAVFDGVICSGSLHLFPDTVLALREIARTMKPGAPLSVQTFVSGNTPVNWYVQKRSWLHTFEIAELQQDLVEAGFRGFRPKAEGIAVTFSARKATSSI